MTPPTPEALARWLYDTEPRRADHGRYTWDYLPPTGFRSKEHYVQWAAALLAWLEEPR